MGRGHNMNTWVPLDNTEDLDGSAAGSKPMELVIIALGGCTGMDVVSILKKMQVEYSEFTLDIDAENSQEHPKVFTKIHIVYKFTTSEENKEKIEKAIRLSSERYCPVSAMLRKTADVTTELIIDPASS